MPDYFINAMLFGITFGGDIHKSRMPASHFTVGKKGYYHLLFFGIDERC